MALQSRHTGLHPGAGPGPHGNSSSSGIPGRRPRQSSGFPLSQHPHPIPTVRGVHAVPCTERSGSLGPALGLSLCLCSHAPVPPFLRSSCSAGSCRGQPCTSPCTRRFSLSHLWGLSLSWLVQLSRASSLSHFHLHANSPCLVPGLQLTLWAGGLQVKGSGALLATQRRLLHICPCSLWPLCFEPLPSGSATLACPLSAVSLVCWLLSSPFPVTCKATSERSTSLPASLSGGDTITPITQVQRLCPHCLPRC